MGCERLFTPYQGQHHLQWLQPCVIPLPLLGVGAAEPESQGHPRVYRALFMLGGPAGSVEVVNAHTTQAAV